MTLRDLNIATRARLSFALVALLVFFLGGFALTKMSAMQKESAEVSKNWLPSILALDALAQNTLRLRAITLRLIVNRDADDQAANGQRADELKRSLIENERRYEALISSAEERASYDRFVTALTKYLQDQEELTRFTQ